MAQNVNKRTNPQKAGKRVLKQNQDRHFNWLLDHLKVSLFFLCYYFSKVTGNNTRCCESVHCDVTTPPANRCLRLYFPVTTNKNSSSTESDHSIVASLNKALGETLPAAGHLLLHQQLLEVSGAAQHHHHSFHSDSSPYAKTDEYIVMNHSHKHNQRKPHTL